MLYYTPTCHCCLTVLRVPKVPALRLTAARFTFTSWIHARSSSIPYPGQGDLAVTFFYYNHLIQAVMSLDHSQCFNIHCRVKWGNSERAGIMDWGQSSTLLGQSCLIDINKLSGIQISL